MESSNDPDVSSDFPTPTIFDRSRFPNLDQQGNLPYTSTGSHNHYDQAQNFQPHATNDGNQVTEQPMRPQAVYFQHQSCQAQAPNDGYQVDEQPMRSQTVYGQPQGFPVENRRYEVSANRPQPEVEPPQEVDNAVYFTTLIKEAARVHKKIVNDKDQELVAQQTASKAQLESATAEIIRLQNVERSKTGEFEQLNEKMNELDTGFKRALNENQNLKEQLVQQGHEKQLLNETLHEKTSEIQTMTEQLSDTIRQLEESNVHAAALNGTLAEKEVEINQLNAQTSSLRGELAAEKVDNHKIASELETLKVENQNLKLELTKKKKTTIQQNFLMVSSTITDAAQKTVRNGEQNKSVKRRIPTINIESGAETITNDGSEQEEVRSAKKIERESLKRKRNVKIQICSSTTRYCDADESSHNKNGPSPT